MRFHRNAKLGLAGRRELVLAIAGGSCEEGFVYLMAAVVADEEPLELVQPGEGAPGVVAS